MSCGEIVLRLPRFAEDALPDAERRLVRAHLASCDGCRRAAVETDASLAFARISPEPVSPADVAWVLEGVRHGVALRRAEARVAPRRRASLSAAAGAAAALAMTLALPGGLSQSSSAPETPVVQRPAPSAAVLPAAAPRRTEVRPMEGTDSGATVYDWNPGGGEPRVVWIVDRSLDI